MHEFLALIELIIWSAGLTLTGACIMKALSFQRLHGVERFAYAYWLGYVVMGLVMFFAGLGGVMSGYVISAVFVLAAGTLLGVNFYHQSLGSTKRKAPPLWCWEKSHYTALLVLAVALLNLPAALVPPTDAQALAYDFYLPRYFAQLGALDFRPVADLFAVPLLSQINGAAAYIAGGENLMVLHAWFNALMMGVSAYALARYKLRTGASWLFAACVMSIPAVFYGATSGISEIPMMALMMLATLALIRYSRAEKQRWLVLSAVFAGGLIATGYLGLVAVAALVIGLWVTLKGKGFSVLIGHTMVFLGVMCVLGGQWYVWNYVNTGDPLFPHLFNYVGSSIWTAEQAKLFGDFTSNTLWQQGRTIMDFVTTPLQATVSSDTTRAPYTGLGPLLLMSLVPALCIFIRRFPRKWAEPVGAMELMVGMFLVFYMLWFALSVNAQPYNLLPMMPLVMLPVWAWGLQMVARARYIPRQILTLSVVIILGGQMAFGMWINKDSYAVLFRKIQPETYRIRHTEAYPVASYLNETLASDAKVMHTGMPTLNYYLNVPTFYADAVRQNMVPLAQGSTTDVLNALWREGVTHWVTQSNPMVADYDTLQNGHRILRALEGYGCVRLQARANTPAQDGDAGVYYVYKLVPLCTAKHTQTQAWASFIAQK